MAETKKYKEVRSRYAHSVRKDTFDKFYNKDWTDTKKYFEYMVKMWSGSKRRKGIYNNTSITDFVQKVKEFDELLPYIPNKDIYCKLYDNYTNLCSVVEDAQITKACNHFKKEDHVTEILENERFVVVEPKTHLGSLKYGASTRWCTASKGNPWTFDSYVSKGLLVYIIDKTKNRNKNYEKIAIYLKYKNAVNLFGIPYLTFNALDNNISDQVLMNNGWAFEELALIDLCVRNHCHEKIRLDQSKKYVKKTISKLEGVNLERLSKEINYLKNNGNDENFNDTYVTIQKFLNKLRVFST